VSARASQPPTRRAPVPAGHLLAIAIGAAAGGYLRVGLSLSSFTGSAASWPWVTFSVNLAGTFVLACTVAFLHARGRSASVYRPLIGVGFCGALTTFSTLQLEVFRMLRADHWLLACGYAGASVLAGLAVAFAGLALGSRSRSA
jgi:CrcB protein